MPASRISLSWRSAWYPVVLVAISLTWLVVGQDQLWVWWALVPVFVVVLVIWVARMLRIAGQVCDDMPLDPRWGITRGGVDDPAVSVARSQHTRADRRV